LFTRDAGLRGCRPPSTYLKSCRLSSGRLLSTPNLFATIFVSGGIHDISSVAKLLLSPRSEENSRISGYDLKNYDGQKVYLLLSIKKLLRERQQIFAMSMCILLTSLLLNLLPPSSEKMLRWHYCSFSSTFFPNRKVISLAAETDLNFIGMLGEVSLSSRKLSLL
jgi:hypothetical protein